jgi:amino acid adenylation domain-containing protein
MQLDKSICEQFEHQAAERPLSIAVAFAGEQLTYDELNRRANQLGHYLRRCGIGPDVLVGICMERSLDMVLGILGVLKAGGAYVPLDPEYPAQRLAYMVEDVKPVVTLTQRRLKELLPPGGRKIVELDGEWDSIGTESTANLAVKVAPENLAYVIYTSGSTGWPKGAMNTYKGIRNRLAWMQQEYQLNSEDRVLQKTPFSFDVSVWEFLWPLIVGARLIVAEPGGHRDPDYLARVIVDQQITTLHFVPSMLAAFLSAGGAKWCCSVKRVLCSGEALLPTLAKQCLVSIPAELHNLYGPTEAAIDVSSYRCSQEEMQRGIPIGKPISNTQLYVLDEQMNPVAEGITGELYIGGAGLARGYWERPRLTAERFLPKPLSTITGERLYRTGDLARFQKDGNLDFLGRADHQVKIRGYRIELGEIEAALLSIEEVSETVVTVAEETLGDQRLIGWVLGNGKESLNVNKIRAALKAKLPEYMVPSIFVVLKEMPLTANGKIDRRALPKADVPRAEMYEPPETPEQEVVTGIMEQILGVERIGIQEDFFKLGGHSLLAMRVITQLRKAFQVELSLRSLFEHPTVRGIAQQVEMALDEGGEVRDPQIKRADPAEPLSLSYAQQRMWFLNQLEPGTPLYNVYVGYRLRGELNQEALKWSLREIVRRHDVLRTRFPLQESATMELASADELVAIAVHDLTMLSAADLKQEVQNRIAKEIREPFCMGAAPLVRMTVLRLHEKEHLLLLVMHHIVADEWSMGVLLKELMRLYGARRLGQESPLKELEIQCADYAVWQRGCLDRAMLDRELDYWREQLKGASDVLEVPTDYVRPAVMKHNGATHSFVLPASLSRSLRELSQREAATLFMILLTGYAALLMRLGGQEDISIGIPITNRTRAEMEGLIGLFVNTAVMRMNVGGDPSFRELLGRVRETTLGAYAHQDVPFEMVVKALRPERNLSQAPLFQVMFTLQSEAAQNEELTEFQVDEIDIHMGNGTSKFDLTLIVQDSHVDLTCQFEYRTELFHARTIQRMARQLEMLLEGAVAEPGQRVNAIAIQTEAERYHLVVTRNRTEAKYAGKTNVVQMFEEQAATQPEALALVSKTERLSYRELNGRANQLAHYLRKLGVGPEAKVGVCLDRSVGLVVGTLGIVKAGGAYVAMDASYPAERLSYIVKDAGMKVLLTGEKVQEAMRGMGAKVRFLDIDNDTDWEAVSRHSQTNLKRVTDAGNLAYVIYTSGTTGQPKGVEISHKGLRNLVKWHCETYQMSGRDRGTLVAGTGFDASVWEMWPNLASGASLHIVEEATRGIPQQLQRWLREEGITVSFLPTPLAEGVLELNTPMGGNLRELLTGGDALRRRPREGESFRLVNHYGPTENTVVATSGEVSEQGKWMPGIGRPMANTQVYVLDEWMGPVALKVAGELYLGGAGLARGYLNHARLTAEKFVPNPFGETSGDRLYRTGDWARWVSDGSVEFLGRRDDQVKVRGQRIELGEIETALLGIIGIAEAVVVAREGDKELVGYVVGRGSEAPNLDDIRRVLRAKLPEHMVPGLLVVLDKMPLTANGKVDRLAMPAATATRPDNHEGPRTLEEDVMASIWAQVLEVERVGIDENFFELGGHSLLAMRVMSRIREAFHLDLPVRVLFESPTIGRVTRSILKLADEENSRNEKLKDITALIENYSEDEIDTFLAAKAKHLN